MVKQFDSKVLRDVAGSFPTGITVICMRNVENDPVGITANSFLSLSLDPPLVSFSVMKESHLLQNLEIGATACISILSNTQKEISDHFAGIKKISKINFEENIEGDIIEGCLGWYITKVEQLIPAGDHYLVICRVLNLGKNEGEPIMFYNGYRQIGEELN